MNGVLTVHTHFQLRYEWCANSSYTSLTSALLDVKNMTASNKYVVYYTCSLVIFILFVNLNINEQ